MRHRNAGKKLSRTSSHRKAMFKNMAVSLLDNEIIVTTLCKAKELRRIVEPFITKAKHDSVANRRFVFNHLRDKRIVWKLFTVLGPKYEQRPGGYSRIIKYNFRAGDKAPMAVIELV